jgi:hypothetical protein
MLRVGALFSHQPTSCWLGQLHEAATCAERPTSCDKNRDKEELCRGFGVISAGVGGAFWSFHSAVSKGLKVVGISDLVKDDDGHVCSGEGLSCPGEGSGEGFPAKAKAPLPSLPALRQRPPTKAATVKAAAPLKAILEKEAPVKTTPTLFSATLERATVTAKGRVTNTGSPTLYSVARKTLFGESFDLSSLRKMLVRLQEEIACLSGLALFECGPLGSGSKPSDSRPKPKTRVPKEPAFLASEFPGPNPKRLRIFHWPQFLQRQLVTQKGKPPWSSP